MAALATGWFWTVGIVTLSLVPVIIKSRIGGGIDVEIAINLIFAVGIAAGSLGAAVLSRGRIELAPAPFLLLVMAALAIDLGLATNAMAPASREVPLGEFFMSPFGLRVAFELFLFSAAAGLFVVPIFAAIQAWAGEERRARVVGAVNALNYLMMVAGSLATMLLLQVLGLSEPMALVVLGLANILAALYLFRRSAGELPRLLPSPVCGRAHVPPGGQGDRAPAAGGRTRGRRRQSRLLPRRADPALAHGGAAPVRDRPRSRAALVDQSPPEARRRQPGRSVAPADGAGAGQTGARGPRRWRSSRKGASPSPAR